MNSNFRFSIDPGFKKDIRNLWDVSFLGLYGFVVMAILVGFSISIYLTATGKPIMAGLNVTLSLIVLTAIFSVAIYGHWKRLFAKVENKSQVKNTVELDAILMLLKIPKYKFSYELIASLANWNNENDHGEKERLKEDCIRQFDLDINNLVEAQVNERGKPLHAKEKLNLLSILNAIAEVGNINLSNPSLVNKLTESTELLDSPVSAGTIRKRINEAIGLKPTK